MPTARFTLVGKSPISFNRALQSAKKASETSADYEKRCWKERLHVDENGEVFIPAIAIKHCLVAAAKYMGDRIPGQGKKTYTAKFKAGLGVSDNLQLGVRADEVTGEWVHVPSNGETGHGTRVYKQFPVVKSWKTRGVVQIYDPIITAEPLKRYLDAGGLLVGLGRFRVQNNGYYGRYAVEDFEYDEA